MLNFLRAVQKYWRVNHIYCDIFFAAGNIFDVQRTKLLRMRRTSSKTAEIYERHRELKMIYFILLATSPHTFYLFSLRCGTKISLY